MRERVRSMLVVLTALLGATGAAAPALAAPAAPAAPATGSVVGHLIDSAGAPLPDHAVTLDPDREDGLGQHYRATTDATGTYTFSGVEPYHYLVSTAGQRWFQADRTWSGAISVRAGATATAPTQTMLRAATLRGTLVSSNDGSPLAGQPVSAEGPSTTTAADGTFTLAVRPGTVHLVLGRWPFWFTVARTLTPAEGATSDLGSIPLDPAGTADATTVSRSGHPVGDDIRVVAVDGCVLATAAPSSCPGAEGGGEYQLRPGQHTLRYLVSDPLRTRRWQVTRTVDVQGGRRTAVPIVVPVVDPATRAAIRTTHYRRGHPIVLRVSEGLYLDGAKPRLPVTIRIDGHVVRPTSEHWQPAPTVADAPDLLVATLPVRWSRAESVRVRVIARARGGYAAQATPTTTLTRSR